SEEIPFLVVRPVGISQIVTHKFIETSLLSSWAFFFIIIPFVGAYACHEQLSVLFSVWTFLFSIPFLVVCSGIGSLLTMLFVRWFPMGKVARVTGGALAAVACFFLWRAGRQVPGLLGGSTFDLSRIVPGLSLASNALLPSTWAAHGILAVVRAQWVRGLMFWLVLASTAGVVLVTAEWLGGRIFYGAWQKVIAGGGGRRRAPLLLDGLSIALSRFAHDVRALLMKDIRTFLRDPMQWSQALIFFGLLAMYFLNIRAFRYHVLPARWRNTIAFLNVFSVSAVMCSLGSRFVYPQLSLEGQAFWILGLSPTRPSRILMTKFVTALTGLLCVSVVLSLLSGRMLNSALPVRITSVALSASVAAAVSALSTGLGAIFLDLRQRNPSAIVSGFGGTLNLVIGLAFMLAVILPFAVVFHLHYVAGLEGPPFVRLIAGCSGWLLLATGLVVALPLRLAAKSLAAREF
ncbi:MAG: hypothetical protein HQ559_16300, partial [Lentisphaerae bacterium]|nr:hypothetical protein [Lentisphaerota bacterium]